MGPFLAAPPRAGRLVLLARSTEHGAGRAQEGRNPLEFIHREAGWEVRSFLRAVYCASRVSAESLLFAFFSAKPGF